MNFDRDQLVSALSVVSGAADNRPTIPSLAFARLRVSDSIATLSATDLGIEWVASIGADGGDMDIAVPARKLLEIAKSAPSGVTLAVEHSRDRLQIRHSRSKVALATIPSDDCPEVVQPTTKDTTAVPAQALRAILQSVQHAMAAEDVRHYLKGVYLEMGSGWLRGTATDGHRLAHHCVPMVSDENWSAIVPRKAVTELLRHLPDDAESEIGLTLDGTNLFVSVGAFRLRTKLIDGRFPDYARVIPSWPAVVTVDRAEMIAALRRASIVHDGKIRVVQMIVDPGEICLSGESINRDTSEESLSCEYVGKRITIAYTAAYMVDALNALPDDRVQIHMRDGESSMMVMGAGACRQVVMPTRM